MSKIIKGYNTSFFRNTCYLPNLSKKERRTINPDDEINRFSNAANIRKELNQMDEQNYWKCIGVLCRANKHGDKFIERLRAEGICSND